MSGNSWKLTICTWTGPSCFKTNNVINVSLKLWSLNIGIYANIFAEKMWEVFAFAKATHIFSAKIPVNYLDIILTGTVNILTTYELVKLTMLWTTGPWYVSWSFVWTLSGEKIPLHMCKSADSDHPLHDPFSKGTWYAEKRTVSHKFCRPRTMVEKLPRVSSLLNP